MATRLEDAIEESRRVLRGLRTVEWMPLEVRCPHNCPACREHEAERREQRERIVAAQGPGAYTEAGGRAGVGAVAIPSRTAAPPSRRRCPAPRTRAPRAARGG
jgi:hypothetical protein